MTAQNMGKKILADAGYNVLAVSNGAAAIKKIASDRPDIIILDVYMPGYTGLEVCERVKGARETSRIPVLLTVGKMEPFKPEEANRVRADGVMIKPFEATDLLAAIEGIAKKMKSAIAPDGPSPVPSLAKQLHVPEDEEAQFEVAHRPAKPEETLRQGPAQIAEFSIPVAPIVLDQAPSDGDHLELSAFSILEPAGSDIVTEESPAPAPLVGLDSTEAPMTRVMAGHDFFTVAQPAYSPVPEETPVDSPAAFFASEAMATSETAGPVFRLKQFEEVAPAAQPAVNFDPVTPELETSRAPSVVSPTEELATNVVAPIEVLAEASLELEINSPIHLQPEINVVQDAALVTAAEDMAQFSTHFGSHQTEDVHVGIAADLPAEQLAAITASDADTIGLDVRRQVPELEPLEIVVPPIVPLEVPRPVLEDVNVIATEAPPTATHAGVLGEVGSIEPEAALNQTTPMAAYVPWLEDTQPIPAYVAREAEPSPVAAEQPIRQPVPEEPSAAPMVEAAAAAAAGATAAATAATHYFIASQPVSDLGPFPVESLAVEGAEPQPAPPGEIAAEAAASFAPGPPSGDAAFAAELAQTLAEKQAAVLATTTAIEPAPTGSGEMEPASETTRLSEAVSRAFDRLRPQLIAEILKEIKK
jgi:CheY-like chemotaxis protein